MRIGIIVGVIAFLAVFACELSADDANLAKPIFLEAETFTLSGKGWYSRNHFPAWYKGTPSGGKVLSGYKGGGDTASKEIVIPALRCIPGTTT